MLDILTEEVSVQNRVSHLILSHPSIFNNRFTTTASNDCFTATNLALESARMPRGSRTQSLANRIVATPKLEFPQSSEPPSDAQQVASISGESGKTRDIAKASAAEKAAVIVTPLARQAVSSSDLDIASVAVLQ